jgi:hypothetical protein
VSRKRPKLAPQCDLTSLKFFILGRDLIDLNDHIVDRAMVIVVNDPALDSVNCLLGIFYVLIRSMQQIAFKSFLTRATWRGPRI